MKRLFYAVIVIVCCFCSAASAGGHVGMECTVPGQNNGAVITADLYQQNGDTVLVSSLLPDLAVILHHGSDTDDMLHALFCFSPQDMRFALQAADHILKDWLQLLNMKSHSGRYSGEIFEYASSMNTSSFQLSDFSRFLDSVIKKEDYSGSEEECGSAVFYCFLSDSAKKLKSLSETEKILVTMRCYDDNRYYSFAVQKQNEVICTLSVDCTEDDTRRFVTGHKENGTYYYDDITISAGSNSVTVDKSIYSGMQSSFLNLSQQAPLVHASFSLKEGKDSGRAYEYKAESAALPDPLIISGTVCDNDISMAVRAGENRSEIALLSVCYDNMKNPVSFSDKKILDCNITDENAVIRINALTAFMMLADMVFPNLPLSYQKIILSLMPGF